MGQSGQIIVVPSAARRGVKVNEVAAEVDIGGRIERVEGAQTALRHCWGGGEEETEPKKGRRTGNDRLESAFHRHLLSVSYQLFCFRLAIREAI
jgi:hypothetical protein